MRGTIHRSVARRGSVASLVACLSVGPLYADTSPPLLGDLEASGGGNYAAVYCEGKGDSETLPIDPRELISGTNIENPVYAVWFNDPFEICETPLLFETQARQNASLVSKGEQADGLDPSSTPNRERAALDDYDEAHNQCFFMLFRPLHKTAFELSCPCCHIPKPRSWDCLDPEAWIEPSFTLCYRAWWDPRPGLPSCEFIPQELLHFIPQVGGLFKIHIHRFGCFSGNELLGRNGLNFGIHGNLMALRLC